MYNTTVLNLKVYIDLAPKSVCVLRNRAPARYGSNTYILPSTRIDLYKTSFAFSWLSVSNSLRPKMKRTSLCVVLK